MLDWKHLQEIDGSTYPAKGNVCTVSNKRYIYIHCGSVTAGHPHCDTIREAKLIFGISTFREGMIGMIDPTTTLVVFSGEVWFQTSEHANNNFRTLIHKVPLPDVMFSADTISSY